MTDKIKKPAEISKEEGFITDYDLYLLAHGTHYKIYEKLGSHLTVNNGLNGVNFAVWAPNAETVSVIGDFNEWNNSKNVMTKLNEGGVWTVFIPNIEEGALYKFAVKPHGRDYLYKIDPYAFRAEHRPKTASIVENINRYTWSDEEWMKKREADKYRCPWKCPMSIYEVHLGSWQKDYKNKDFPNEWGYKSYRQLAYELVKYVKKMGYTHVELLPIMEHPLDKSWGYQVTNYYAPTSRYGTPEDFMFFIDYCHQNGIGVILDWVPAHFPADDHALSFFDGTQIYAYQNRKKGVHKDWGTYIFDYGRNEVQNFLIGNALFWLEKYHADGLRVDAVASMLYLDYSRSHGEWEPNIHGGRENLEAINFVKHLNDIVHRRLPGTYMIAEESTSWPGVTHDVKHGGLGFDMKWNMGWMNDVLFYFAQDPIYRKFHHIKLTFSLWYAFSENFILPVSHDEVVYGKHTLLEKMPGDRWQKFANVRLFLGFMFGHPGKKLNFMTTDIGQYNEWFCDVSLDWDELDNDLNNKLNLFMQDLNRVYTNNRAFFELDFEYRGFQWIDLSDAVNSILAFYRISDDGKEVVVFMFNMTPVPRENYGFGVPVPGYYKEILNSDAEIYGGSGKGNFGGVQSQPERSNQWEHSIKITIPPLGVVVFRLET